MDLDDVPSVGRRLNIPSEEVRSLRDSSGCGMQKAVDFLAREKAREIIGGSDMPDDMKQLLMAMAERCFR